MESNYAIGIDIGGTSTKFGLVTRNGEIVNSGSMETTGYKDPRDFITALKKVLDPLVSKASGAGNIAGIGVGAPNANYFTGCIEHAANLEWKGIIPLVKLIEEKFSLPAFLTNDANAAAVGERMYGVARGMNDFIMITLGTGVGSGIIANGRLLLGHDGFAGELGHTCIRPGGRIHPSTGLAGSLESYCSAGGVVQTAIELLHSDSSPSLMRKIAETELSSKNIYDCAIQNDKIALEVFNYTGTILGEALANFVMFSSPEAIVLFGGLSRAGNLILEPMRNSMEKNLLKVFQNKVKILISQLNESDAAILGASALVWNNKQATLRPNL